MPHDAEDAPVWHPLEPVQGWPQWHMERMLRGAPITEVDKDTIRQTLDKYGWTEESVNRLVESVKFYNVDKIGRGSAWGTYYAPGADAYLKAETNWPNNRDRVEMGVGGTVLVKRGIPPGAGVLEHEAEHAIDLENPGYDPIFGSVKGRTQDMRDLSRGYQLDPQGRQFVQSPASREAANIMAARYTEGLAVEHPSPVDSAHLNTALIDELNFDYSQLPPDYASRNFPYAKYGPSEVTAALEALQVDRARTEAQANFFGTAAQVPYTGPDDRDSDYEDPYPAMTWQEFGGVPGPTGAELTLPVSYKNLAQILGIY